MRYQYRGRHKLKGLNTRRDLLMNLWSCRRPLRCTVACPLLIGTVAADTCTFAVALGRVLLVDTAVTVVAVTIILGASTANTRWTTVALWGVLLVDTAVAVVTLAIILGASTTSAWGATVAFWLVVTLVALVAVATILGASTASTRRGTCAAVTDASAVFVHLNAECVGWM